MQRISVTFDFLVTELHLFFLDNRMRSHFFFWEGGGGVVVDWLFQGLLRV